MHSWRAEDEKVRLLLSNLKFQEREAGNRGRRQSSLDRPIHQIRNTPLINDKLLPGGVAKQCDKILALMSAGWTNERHSTYISSMEASFLDQLYGLDNHRIDAKRSHLGGNGLKVVRDGVCKNIRFEGADARMHDGVTSGLPDNLLIRSFRPRNAGLNRRGDGAEDSVDDYGSGTDTVREKVQIHGRRGKCFAEENFIEVSDQNFSEEAVNVFFLRERRGGQC